MGGAKDKRRRTSRYLSNSGVAIAGLLTVQTDRSIRFTLAEEGSVLRRASAIFFNCVLETAEFGEKIKSVWLFDDSPVNTAW